MTPLQQRKPDGSPYVRPDSVVQAIEDLSRLSIAEVARRAVINDHTDSEYVRSECLVYFVRQSKAHGDTQPYQVIFEALRKRVLRAVPVVARKVTDSTASGEDIFGLEVRDFVLQKFQELLCSDRQQYDARLDYYEIRFNDAVATLRMTAKRKAAQRQSKVASSALEGTPEGASPEVEKALERLRKEKEDGEAENICRFQVHAAISQLPAKEREVIELLLQGIPIDSEDDGTVTIRKILGCSEKTVRNRRDKAYAIIRELLKKEDES